MCVRVRVRTYGCVRASVGVCVDVCMCAYVYAHMFIYVYTNIHIYKYAACPYRAGWKQHLHQDKNMSNILSQHIAH